MKNSSFISLRSISLSYDKSSKVLQNLNLNIEQGSFVSIIGPSSSGKTSILNLIAGFNKPENGKILLNGIDIKDIPPHQRPTATVFQDYALFPHLNVYENIAFGLKKMYTDLNQIQEEKKEEIRLKQEKAFAISNKKINNINKKIKKYVKLIYFYDKKWNFRNKKSLFFNLKLFYVRAIKKKIMDLDYWKSYWEYYPIIIAKKLKEKYLQRPLNKEEIHKQVFEMIDLIGLNNKAYANIKTLSGGTKQKVALARSLITKPQILLLDEPLSAIDKNIREKMQLELKRLHKKFKITFVLITHDQKESLILSDKIVVLRKGKIEQIGSPSEIYDAPVNSWVANFMGKANLFDGTYTNTGEVLVKEKIFYTDIKQGFAINESVIVMIRPEDYDVVEYQKGIISVQVIDSIYKGQLWELKCQFYEEIIYIENIDEVKKGERIGLVWDPMDVHVMKAENQYI